MAENSQKNEYPQNSSAPYAPPPPSFPPVNGGTPLPPFPPGIPPVQPVPYTPRKETQAYRAMAEAVLNEKGVLTSLFCAVFCVLFCDILFWGGLGASVPGMLLLYEAFAFWLFKGRGAHKAAYLLALPIGLISLGFLLYWNPSSQFISVLTLLGLLGAQLALFSGVPLRGVFTFDLLSKALLNILIRPLEYLDFPFRTLGTLKNSKSPAVRTVTKILLGLLLSLPAAGILIFLFSCADAVFEHLTSTVADALGLHIGHLIFDCIAACILALFASAVLLFNRGADLTGQKSRTLIRRWDPTVCGSFLVIVDLISAVFVAVQFTYFFGGRSTVASVGLSYAEYARRGFFELAWATGFVFLLSALILAFCRRADEKKLPLFIRITLLLLCLCNGVILTSSVCRMLLYVEVYGLSIKRLLTLWFMALVALCLVWMLLRCIWQRFPAAAAVCCTVISMVSLLSLCNTDRIVAHYNVELFQAGSQEIDIDYLGSLSPSALPELTRLHSIMPDDSPEDGIQQKTRLAFYITQLADKLENRHKVYAFTFDRLSIIPILEHWTGDACLTL